MIDQIHLLKDGFYASEYNENLERTELVKIHNPFWYYYNHELFIGDDITFGDVFLHLEPYLDKLDEHFLAETRGWKMKDWFEEIKKDQTKEETDFFEIRFNWIIDVSSIFDRKTSKYENSFSKYLTFSVMAKSEENEEEEVRYSISFMKIQNLRDLPITFDKHCKFGLFNSETKEMDNLFEFEDGISLREFIACLFNEITFYGSPEETNLEFKKLKESIEEFDNRDKDDETKSTPFYKIQLEWLEEELNEALSEENFEWAENVRIEIERIKNQHL